MEKPELKEDPLKKSEIPYKNWKTLNKNKKILSENEIPPLKMEDPD